jgi:serine/threonine protein phosphatase PrpC
LLQCIGAKAAVEPEFYGGGYRPETVFLLCTDGYRHVVSPRELYEGLNPATMLSEEQMFANLALLVELNKRRNETDNITAVAIRALP